MSNYSGGLAGLNRGSITQAYNTGSVFGSSSTGNSCGGLVGENLMGAITNAYSTGSVIGSGVGNLSGGLVGLNRGVMAFVGRITNAYSTGNVFGSSEGANYSGGLVGQNFTGTITQAYSTGSVFGGSSASSNLSGGLVGLNSNGSITNAYSAGGVLGSGTVNISGGLVGSNVTATIAGSFWDTETSGLATSAGGTGKTTAEMKSSATFAGWDNAIWKFYDGLSYPLLRLFLTPMTATANNAAKAFDGIPYSGGNGVSYTSPAGVDTGSVLGSPAYTGTSQGAVNPGSYIITPGGLYSDQQGYDIGYASGTLTIGGMPVSSVVVDPLTPSTLYAGLDGAGIYKSINSGANWTAATTQPTNMKVKALVIKPGDSTKLYAATYGGGGFASTDSGDNWAVCANTNLTNLKVVSLTIDASGKLYAGTEAGVFVSTTDCGTWTAMSNGLP